MAVKNNKNMTSKPLFFGDSLVDYMPDSWDLINNGIAGMTAYALKYILDERVVRFNPECAVLHIGANDLRFTVQSEPEEIAQNVKNIFIDLIEQLPHTKFYLISTLPCVDHLEDLGSLKKQVPMNQVHTQLNLEYHKALEGLGIEHIDLNQYLMNDDGSVKAEYYEDSLHLNESGYEFLLESYLASLEKA